MHKCPRCHSSMILEFGDVYDGYAHLWRCVCCGREIYSDRARQAEDETLAQTVFTTGEPRHERGAARRGLMRP